MSENQKAAFAAVISFVLLAGFGFVHIHALFRPVEDSWPGKELSMFITAVSGLVTAVVAMAFNEKLNAQPERPAGQTDGQRVKEALVGLVSANKFWSVPTMTTLYVFIYFLTGTAALVLTLTKGGENVIEITKIHGLTTSGLLLVIAKSFFTIK